jgi:hypothetical protein
MVYLVSTLALAVAAAFTGAAIYVNVAEHPARMKLDVKHALAQWQPAYKLGTRMQASLALIGTVLAALAGWLSGNWCWYLAAAFILAPWPYTLALIMPVNKKLEAIAPEAADEYTRALLERWNRLHMGRSVLGLLAVLTMVWIGSGW